MILRVRRGESLAKLPGWSGLARLWDASEPQVVLEQKLAGVHGFRLEGRAVGRDEPPVGDLATQQFDESNRREVFADFRVGEIGGLRKNEPDAVVFWLFWTVTQHERDLLSEIDGEPRKHGSHFGLERSKSFDDEREWGRPTLGLGRAGYSVTSGHFARIAHYD